jgi:hypothetical protein
MLKRLLATVLFSGIVVLPSLAQTAETADASILAGKWTYRSYVNSTALVNRDKDKALAVIFGEGTYTFDPPSGTAFTGSLDMGNGRILDLTGKITQTAPLSVAISGHGRAGTPTEGWEYDYNASLAYQWPEGVDQAPALLGSVIRAKAHGSGPAGVVASFIAVKQP